MKQPSMKKLDMSLLINQIFQLPPIGQLKVSSDKLIYLDISDAFIHQLYPLLPNSVIKPDYFKPGDIGAHISIIYPNEATSINNEDFMQEYNFTVRELVCAELEWKQYYALLIESTPLLELRRRYGLPDLLCFKGYAVGFHITIGTGSSLVPF